MSRVRTESAGDSVCPVCHENSEIFAIGPCDHPICYRCSTRMRVLCDQMYCPICRGDLHQIVFLTSKQKYDGVERRSCIPNRKYKILLEDESVEDAFEALLEHRCLVCDTRPLFDSFQGLQIHVKRTHALYACDLCVNHLKIFPYERKFYNRKDLATHRRIGDPDNRSYRGHPLCRFCDDRFMDSDELLRHLRQSHYYCHFCDANTSSNMYFDDYPDLKEHFKKEHFLCEEGQCGLVETRFTNAFVSNIDLKAHITAEHLGNKSKAEARELRTIDFNFHMAPRRRGRDTGVVSPDDFEEVGESNRSPRDRPNRRYNRRDAPPRNENLTPPPEAGPPAPPEPPALDDFPTLNNCPPPFLPISVQKREEAVEDFPSLSSTKPSKSATPAPASLVSAAVAHPGKSNSGASNVKRVNNFSTAASVMTNTETSRPGSAQNRSLGASRPAQAATVTKQSWSAPRLSSGEDFPSLGGGKKKSGNGGPNLLSHGAWIKKHSSNSAKPQSASKGGRDSPSLNVVPSLTSLGKSLCDDGEFPSLGGGSGSGGAMSGHGMWVKKTKPVKNRTERSTPLGNNLDMSLRSKHNKDDDDGFIPWNGRSENGTDETKSKKKKKKQKEKAQEAKASTEDSGISLSSIASELDTVAVITEQSSAVEEDLPMKEVSSHLKSDEKVAPRDLVPSTEPVASAEPSISEEWETVVRKKSVGFQEDDFPSLSALPKKGSGITLSFEDFTGESRKTKKNKSVVDKTPKTFQDDFPALSATSEKKPVPASFELQTSSGKKSMNRNGSAKQPASKMEDDFPTLQSAATKTRPPPGFSSTTQAAAPPPGLGARPSSAGSNAPPGLKNTAPASALSSSASTIPMSVKLNMYSYTALGNEKERNNALVSHVRQLLILKDNGFEQFCALSGEFRSGQKTAQAYLKMCENLFGPGKFLQVLAELIVLLPDILKQHELAEAHSQSILGMCAPLNLTTCPTCHQYLKVEDYPVHFSTHANLGPAFGAAALPLKI